MSLRRVMVLLLIPAAPLLAQLANNTVTVTASQSFTAQPDEAVFSVTVSSGVDKSLDDVVAAVTGLGITATNLVQISSPLTAGSSSVPLPSNVPAPSLGWTFQLAVPFSEMKDTTAALASLQKFYLTKQQWAFTYLLVVKHTDLRAANPQLQSRRPGDEGACAGTGYRQCRGIQGRRDRRPHQRDVERCSAYLLADRALRDGDDVRATRTEYHDHRHAHQ